VLFAAIAGGQLWAEEPNFRLAANVWRADLIGDGHTGDGSRVERFDLRDTLNLDTDDTILTYEAWLRFGKNRVIFGLESSYYEGDETLSANLVYDGLTFNPNTRVLTDFESDRRRLLYDRTLFQSEKFSVGILIGLEDYQIKSELRAKGVPRREVELDSRIPVIGPSLQYRITQRLRVFGEAAGITIDIGGVSSRALYSYAAAEYTIVGRFLSVALGYRYTILKGEEDSETRFDLEQQGTFLGLSLSL
jgi:hypothetical protein